MKPDGKWKYSEEDVDKLLAVAWKVPSDYEADDDLLQYICTSESNFAAMIVTYPRTEVLICFKDRVTLLEARGGFQCFLHCKVLTDRIIYKMAKEREWKFMKASGGGLQGGSQKSVHFMDDGGALSEYSIGGLCRGDREVSPARGHASRNADIMDENHSLWERLWQLEKSREPESDSDSYSTYSAWRSRTSHQQGRRVRAADLAD
ncbi:hypothetical protein FQN50_009986 [Emmonsiellopsis sp. PD_5]|nr:hypothetical protein FQN50_009986 [Emmonsiellopsis sp. PD_5]